MDKQKIKSSPLQRNLILRSEDIRKDETDERVLELSASSETPYERWFGIEILDHNPKSIRMERIKSAAPLLYQHDPDKQIGVVEEFRVEDKKTIVKVRFSSASFADEIYKDVIDGIRRNVSIGYMVHDLVLEEKEEEISTYRITDWEPYEISMVSIPADFTIGVNREFEDKINKLNMGSIEMGPEEKVLNEQEVLKNERTRIAEISALGQRHGIDYQTAIEKGVSVAEYRGYVLDKIGESKPLYQEASETVLTNEKEVKEYSLFRAINNPNSGFEKEVSDTLAKRLGITPKGILIPYQKLSTRDMQVGNVGHGAELVGTDFLGSSFIDLLRNKMLTAQLGVPVLSGLQGDVAIPKLSGSAGFGWANGENAAHSEGMQTTTQVTLSPKRGGIFVDLSKKLILQGDPSAEALVINDIIKACALGLDLATLAGTGLLGQPTGIIPTTGVGNVPGAAFSWLKALQFVEAVETANADVANMHWVTTPAIKSTLKSREKIAGQPNFIMNDNTLDGYPVHVTNQMAAGSMLFGDFSQALVGLWGAVDVIVDPYSFATTGLRRITVEQYADVAVRQPGAFCMTTDFA